MGRHKMHLNLPRYVTRGKSCYEYKPYRGRNLKRPYIKLCPLDAPMSEVWAQWERYQERPVDTFTFGLFVRSRICAA